MSGFQGPLDIGRADAVPTIVLRIPAQGVKGDVVETEAIQGMSLAPMGIVGGGW